MNFAKVFLLGFITLLLASCSSEIDISDKEWACKYQQCQITFTIKNNESVNQIRNVRISAFRIKDIGDGAYVTDSIGKKIVQFDLKPNEELEASESIKLLVPTKPTHITITHFEEK